MLGLTRNCARLSIFFTAASAEPRLVQAEPRLVQAELSHRTSDRGEADAGLGPAPFRRAGRRPAHGGRTLLGEGRDSHLHEVNVAVGVGVDTYLAGGHLLLALVGRGLVLAQRCDGTDDVQHTGLERGFGFVVEIHMVTDRNVGLQEFLVNLCSLEVSISNHQADPSLSLIDVQVVTVEATVALHGSFSSLLEVLIFVHGIVCDRVCKMGPDDVSEVNSGFPSNLAWKGHDKKNGILETDKFGVPISSASCFPLNQVLRRKELWVNLSQVLSNGTPCLPTHCHNKIHCVHQVVLCQLHRYVATRGELKREVTWELALEYGKLSFTLAMGRYGIRGAGWFSRVMLRSVACCAGVDGTALNLAMNFEDSEGARGSGGVEEQSRQRSRLVAVVEVAVANDFLDKFVRDVVFA